MSQMFESPKFQWSNIVLSVLLGQHLPRAQSVNSSHFTPSKTDAMFARL